MSAAANYFMDDPREPGRLAEKVEAESWVRVYAAPHLAPGSRVLDVGCGPGVLAAAVARRAPLADVVALDLNDRCLVAAQQRTEGLDNASVVKGDALALPFRDSSFDLVYARFVLEYVSERERAVTEMARVCRTGGLILLQDLDGQLVSNYPVEHRLHDDLTNALEVLATRGFDPFAGRKLFNIAHHAGLVDLAVWPEIYHLIAGPADEATILRWELRLDVAMPAIIEAVGSRRATRIRRGLLRHLAQPDTITFSQLFTVFGRPHGSPTQSPRFDREQR